MGAKTTANGWSSGLFLKIWRGPNRSKLSSTAKLFRTPSITIEGTPKWAHRAPRSKKARQWWQRSWARHRNQHGPMSWREILSQCPSVCSPKLLSKTPTNSVARIDPPHWLIFRLLMQNNRWFFQVIAPRSATRSVNETVKPLSRSHRPRFKAQNWWTNRILLILPGNYLQNLR